VGLTPPCEKNKTSKGASKAEKGMWGFQDLAGSS
jgi:hypothetical protein